MGVQHSFENKIKPQLCFFLKNLLWLKILIIIEQNVTLTVKVKDQTCIQQQIMHLNRQKKLFVTCECS